MPEGAAFTVAGERYVQNRLWVCGKIRLNEIHGGTCMMPGRCVSQRCGRRSELCASMSMRHDLRWTGNTPGSIWRRSANAQSERVTRGPNSRVSVLHLLKAKQLGETDTGWESGAVWAEAAETEAAAGWQGKRRWEYGGGCRFGRFGRCCIPQAFRVRHDPLACLGPVGALPRTRRPACSRLAAATASSSDQPAWLHPFADVSATVAWCDGLSHLIQVGIGVRAASP